jgi:hypothetical protein
MERRVVRGIDGVQAGNGCMVVMLETDDGSRLALEVGLPMLLRLLNTMLHAAIGRWSEMPLPPPLLEPEPAMYQATAVRLKALERPEWQLLLQMRSPHAGPLTVRLRAAMVRPLAERMGLVAQWLALSEPEDLAQSSGSSTRRLRTSD